MFLGNLIYKLCDIGMNIFLFTKLLLEFKIGENLHFKIIFSNSYFIYLNVD